MKPAVFVSETDDRRAFTRAVMRRFSREWSGRKVFVKPSVVSHERYPTTTHPDVLREVLKALTGRGCEVIVGDGPAPDAGSPASIIENHHLQQVCGEFDIELCNLHDEPFRKVMTRTGYKLRVSSVPFDYQYLISLPVIKYHPLTTITGSLENHLGFLQKRERLMMHARLKSMHRSIAELHNVFKANLIIMDGARTMRMANELRHGGKPIRLGYMFAGQDPVALDCAGFNLLRNVLPELEGLNPESVEHIKQATRLGIGRTDYRRAAI
jgi:uncharacterized protein (DUF362 family)